MDKMEKPEEEPEIKQETPHATNQSAVTEPKVEENEPLALPESSNPVPLQTPNTSPPIKSPPKKKPGGHPKESTAASGQEEEEEVDPLERSTEFMIDMEEEDMVEYNKIPQSLRTLLEDADILYHRICTNNTLLDKLRKDLVESKYKYSMYQTDLANAENESVRLKKMKDSQSLNFGEIVNDLVSIVFEEPISNKETGEVEGTDLEALQTFSGLLEKINSAIEKNNGFKIEFTFMDSDDSATRAVVKKKEGSTEKLLALTGDKFKPGGIL